MTKEESESIGVYYVCLVHSENQRIYTCEKSISHDEIRLQRAMVRGRGSEQCSHQKNYGLLGGCSLVKFYFVLALFQFVVIVDSNVFRVSE